MPVVSISREAGSTAETNWRLNAKLVIERAPLRCRVQGTGAPGRASEAILEEPADDRHHGQTSVGKHSWPLLGLFGRIAGGENLEAEVARSSQRHGSEEASP